MDMETIEANEKNENFEEDEKDEDIKITKRRKLVSQELER
jgi:hypothetical protein